MLKNNKIRIVFFVCILLSVSAITLAFGLYLKKSKKRPSAINNQSNIVSAPKYDAILLLKFKNICKKYDTLKLNYTMKGVINMIDKADTGGKMNNVSFLFCKRGDALYYKLGETETMNENGLYLYIDHAAKRVFLSQQKHLNYNDGVQSITAIAKNLQGERYTLTGSVNGSQQSITLVNEHHITCKQYTVSFDTVDMQIRHVYARLTNFQDPLNKNKEKIFSVDLSEWDAKALMDSYPSTASVVKRQDGVWSKTNKYKDYELIDNSLK
jgi:hypothetical protein